MESNEILQFCMEKGLLLDKELLHLFSESSEVESIKFILERVKSYTNKRVITKTIFEENKDKVNKIFLNLPSDTNKSLEKLKINLGLSIEISREVSSDEKHSREGSNLNEMSVVFSPEVLEEDVKVISNFPALTKKLEVKDFVGYFKSRYLEMRNMLQDHAELESLVSINKISGNRQSFSLIGIVSDKKMTKNKNIIFEIEDLTGKIKVLINKDRKDLCKIAEEVTLDSVLGFKGTGSKEILFANEIIFPDARLPERRRSPVDESVLFIGDIHVGSKLFMEKNFLKFIDYLNGNVPGTEEEVKKIKYLFILGDTVAGVGIYPNQDQELAIPDIEAQYCKAAELIGMIRKDIKIIISPGNHDSVRIMEPQPVLDEKFAWALYELKNVILVGNPCLINLGAKNGFSGFNVLNYHGYSYHYYAGNISRLIIEKAVHKPELVMEYLLKHRHLAPTHSSTLYFPSENDPFIIRSVPDIFVSGHTHKSAISYYNNILIVSSSTWESLTAFQEKMGNEPDFCKVPMFNLKTRAIKILDFE